jgi:NAD(P)-dependent dehydrogenase (short-subunit alcohol dehydrogenase family)
MDLGASLRNKHVLVTGASSGLGAHFARVLAGCGAKVTVAARRRDRLEALVGEIGKSAAGAIAVDLDVADEASVESALDGAEKALGPPDVIVNNAGIAEGGLALETSAQEFDRVIATNLRGVWLVSTIAARRWRDAKRGGAIINIASILGFRVSGATSAYAVSKAGVVQMTQAHALEWARFGIRVNALAPGYIATDINRDFFETEHGKAMVKRIPMRRLGEPEDLDGAFLLLASDASRWMTGATIPVDGGHLVSSL